MHSVICIAPFETQFNPGGAGRAQAEAGFHILYLAGTAWTAQPTASGFSFSRYFERNLESLGAMTARQ